MGNQPLKNRSPQEAMHKDREVSVVPHVAELMSAKPRPAQELRGCGAVDVVSTVAVLSGQPAIGICI